MAKQSRDWPPQPEPIGAPLVDDHTHLDAILAWDASGWDAERPDHRPSLVDHLERAHAVGVRAVVQVACDLDSIGWTTNLLRSGPSASPSHRPSPHVTIADVAVVGAVAIHPNEAVLHAGIAEVAPDGLDPDPQERHAISLDDALSVVADTARSHSWVRAIGETGLDYFRSGERGRAAQVESFRAHIALAKELGLVLQIHDREAHRDVIDILLADGAPAATVFHCFSGDAALAEECAAQGWYLSIAGPVTFKANDYARAAVAAVPLSQLLLETDSPFLTPHPFRGRPNSSYLVANTAREVARVRGVSVQEVAEATSETAKRLYLAG